MRNTIRVLHFLSAFAIVFAIGQRQANPCSTFVLHSEAELVFGGNLDFFTSEGLVVINKRGVVKSALLAPPEKPACWVSKYGSITFNQMGRELPFGGMNEKGLVIQMMWLDDTEYPQPDERPAITELQWIQYQLDNAGTVDEVIASDSALRISGLQALSKLHYLVADRHGNVATIEFLGGLRICRTGETLPVPALTNSTYDECLVFNDAFDSMDAVEQMMRTSYDSRDRFAKISRAIRDFRTEGIEPAVEYAFDILQTVSAVRRGSHRTAWSIVYDLQNMRLSFKTYENRNVRLVDLHEFDFACSTPVLALHMDSDINGDAAGEFIECTLATNEGLVGAVVAAYRKAGFLAELPDEVVKSLAHYPEHLRCR